MKVAKRRKTRPKEAESYFLFHRKNDMAEASNDKSYVKCKDLLRSRKCTGDDARHVRGNPCHDHCRICTTNSI